MRRRRIALGALLLLAPVLSTCGARDPRDAVLSERSRWTVTPKNYVQAEDGSVRLSVSVSGPARSTLERLTFRVEFKDAAGQATGENWETVDLTAVPLGAATDFSFQLDTGEIPFEELNLDIDRVLDPTPEQALHIPELQL